MKILFVMKRFSSGKDMVLEDFGRQMRLADELNRLGHKVDFLCADYKAKENFEKIVNGKRVNVIGISVFSIFQLIKRLNKVAKGYDAIIGATDPIFGIIVHRPAKKNKKLFIYDIQDNYETYLTGKIPFLRLLERKAMRDADLVLVESYLLEKKIKRFNKRTLVIPNGVSYDINKVTEKKKARRILNLPLDKKIIVYAGRYHGSHEKEGVDLLLKVFSKLRGQNSKYKDVTLLLIGDGNRQRLKIERNKGNIIALDSMPYKKLMVALSASDVMVLPYTKTRFTQYMLTPYKLPEYMVFNRPIVCSNVGEFKKMLKETRDLVFNPGDHDDFIEKLKKALYYNKKIDYSQELKNYTWENIAKKLNKSLRRIAHKNE